MLDRWRSNPISFIETVLYDPETKKPFKLLPAERAFLEHAFKLDDSGRLLYPEQTLQLPQEKWEDHVRRHSCVDDAAAVRWQLSGSDDLRQRSGTKRRSRVHDDQAHHREQPPAEARGQDHARPHHFPCVRCHHHRHPQQLRHRRRRQPEHLGVRRAVGVHVRALSASLGRAGAAARPARSHVA